MASNCTSRMGAKAVLDEDIRRVENHLESLHAIRRVVDWETLTDEDEVKLYGYFVSKMLRL